MQNRASWYSSNLEVYSTIFVSFLLVYNLFQMGMTLSWQRRGWWCLGKDTFAFFIKLSSSRLFMFTSSRKLWCSCRLYVNLVLYLQEETMRESNKKQEEDLGMPGCKDLDVQACQDYQNINDEHWFPRHEYSRMIQPEYIANINQLKEFCRNRNKKVKWQLKGAEIIVLLFLFRN
jgi:hypothetical protein